jgi:hypothetical protein
MPVTKVRSQWSSGGLQFVARPVTSPPSAIVQVGDTNSLSLAAGVTAIYGWVKQDTTAVTGTVRGLRGNASVLIASASGTVIGVAGRAANGTSTTSTDGVNAGTLRGGDFLVAGVGTGTVNNLQGVYIQLDIDAANLTVDDARGLYVNVQSGNAASNTLTACNLAYLEYESVVGTAPTINSAIKIAGVGGHTGATQLIDASTFNLLLSDTDKVTLLKFKRADGTITYMRYDTGDNALVFATS